MSRLRVLALAAIVLAGLTVSTTSAHADSVVVWTGMADDASWSLGANWSSGVAPGPGDSVLIEAPSDNVCHAHVTGVPTGTTVANLTVDERLFRGDADSPCQTSLDGGSLTVTGQFVFHAGTIGTAITIPAGATGVITPGAAHDTTHLTGALTVQGALTLAGNNGAEYLSLSGSPGIIVAAGATLTTQGDNDLTADCCLSPAHVTNNGTLNVGAGTFLLDAVELDQNAVVNAGAGAQIVTDFAPQTAGPGAKWKGAGAWNMQFGQITATGTQTFSGGFHWILGGHGTTSQEHLLGSFTLAGAGEFDWAGGEIQAAMTVGHRVTVVADGVPTTDARVIDGTDETTTPNTQLSVVLHGTMLFKNGAGYHGVSASRLVVDPDGALNIGADSDLSAESDTSMIVNSGGRITVPPAAAPTTLAASDLGYRATGGSLTVGKNVTLQVGGGSPGLLSGTLVTGLGQLTVAEPMTLTGTSTVDSGSTLNIATGAAMSSSGSAVATATGGGLVSWTGGSITGKVAFTSSKQSISGPSSKRVSVPTGKSATTVTFGGTATIAKGTASSQTYIGSDTGGALVFTGALTVGQYVNCAAAVTTSGTTTVDTAGKPTYFSSWTNSGSLSDAGDLELDNSYVQTGGSTAILPAATLKAGVQVKVQGGTLTGAGTVRGALANTGGTVAPATGATLTVTGSYTSANAATTSFDLSSSGPSVLAVGGAATVMGTLIANDVNGYLAPTGTTATVLTGGSVTLNASCVRTVGDATHHWTAAVVGGTALQLTSVDGESPC